MMKLTVTILVMSAILSATPVWGKIEDAVLEKGNVQLRITDQRGRLTSRYVGNFGKRNFTLYLMANPEDYNLFGRMPHDDLGEMIQHAEREELSVVVEQIRKLAREWNLNQSEMADLTLAVVGAIPYKLDSEDTGNSEYYRYATETLMDGAGDCEDTTILAAALFRSLGYRVILLNPPDHIAIGVAGKFGGGGVKYKNVEYYFAETTGPGWKIGEVPDEYDLSQVRIIEIGQSQVSPRRTDPRPQVTPKRTPPKKKVVSGRKKTGKSPGGFIIGFYNILLVVIIILVLAVPFLLIYISGSKRVKEKPEIGLWKNHKSTNKPGKGKMRHDL